MRSYFRASLLCDPHAEQYQQRQSTKTNGAYMLAKHLPILEDTWCASKAGNWRHAGQSNSGLLHETSLYLLMALEVHVCKQPTRILHCAIENMFQSRKDIHPHSQRLWRQLQVYSPPAVTWRFRGLVSQQVLWSWHLSQSICPERWRENLRETCRRRQRKDQTCDTRRVNLKPGHLVPTCHNTCAFDERRSVIWSTL